MNYNGGYYRQIGSLSDIQITENLDLVKKQLNLSDEVYVSAVSIHAAEGNEVRINNTSFYIGPTQTLEFLDVDIQSLIFPTGSIIDRDTMVTFAITERSK